MNRRDFLKRSGVFLATATLPGLLGACRSNGGPAPSVSPWFPQGIASGDPRASSIVIWTRALPLKSDTIHNVKAELALDAGFETVVMQQVFTVSAASDYTLKVIVENLQPDTDYYYRFLTGAGARSPVGRTLTAPQASDPKEIYFAFVSCQNRQHGFYSAYRQLIADDASLPPDRQIRFVLHLGDYIYETTNDPLMRPVDALFNPIDGGLVDRMGKPREVGSFPDGGTSSTGLHYARTLADYRHLYKETMRDPDLQAAQARWPFIHIWDDHEFSDDGWQSEANYEDLGATSSTDEPSQPRKVAANQAWFEYLPVNLLPLEEVDADLRHAKEFVFADVQETPNAAIDELNRSANADNLKALDSLTIYRSFRMGAWMDLVLTDNRSYRSDHPITEGISGNSPFFVHPRIAMPLEIMNHLDAGRAANAGNPDRVIFVGRFEVNPRFDSPPDTLLGSRQKQWWKETMGRSTARWKLWGNSVPLMRFLVNLSALNQGLPDIALSADSWDGYASERKELMAYLLSNNIPNVVSLSGDYHGHFAGLVLDDFDSPAPETALQVMAEFVCPGLSSVSMFAGLRQLAQRQKPTEIEKLLQGLISYDRADEASPVVNNLNNSLTNGVLSAVAAVETDDLSEIAAAKDDGVNAHLRYADTDGQGFALVHVAENEVKVKLATIRSISNDTGETPPGIRRIASFTVPFADHAGGAVLSDPAIEGEAPFPLSAGG